MYVVLEEPLQVQVVQVSEALAITFFYLLMLVLCIVGIIWAKHERHES